MSPFQVKIQSKAPNDARTHLPTLERVRVHLCLVYFTDDCRLCLLWPSSYESNDANTNLVSTHLQGVDTTAEQENSSNDNLYRQLKCFWKLETIGVKSDENLVHDQFNQGRTKSFPKSRITIFSYFLLKLFFLNFFRPYFYHFANNSITIFLKFSSFD